MARPLRIEFPGAVYHVTSRGDRREPIYRDDHDRLRHLDVIAQAMDRHQASVLAYCLMGNHFHLVVQTHRANLSRVMRHINGIYTQAFNHRHDQVGHVLQGRFKAILVDHEAYLVTLCRYVERNPVAAGLVAHVMDWPWSSVRAHAGRAAAPSWLDQSTLYAHLLGRPAHTDTDRRLAAQRYEQLVGIPTFPQSSNPSSSTIWQMGLQRQIYLGDDRFVTRMQQHVGGSGLHAAEIPKAQRSRPLTVSDCLRHSLSRNEAIHRAHTEAGLTMSAIAEALGLSVSRISRVIAQVQQAKGKT